MGYRVDYGPVKKVRGVEKRMSRRCALTGMFFLVFVVMVCCFWPEGKQALQQLVFPGDGAVTAAAWENFTVSLKAGEGIGESLQTFCMRILEDTGFDPMG